MSLTIGLTGGIASGKSLVASLFRRHGVTIIDADEVARQVVAPETTGLSNLVAHFGEGILDSDGGLDRRRMRERIFANASERRQLEGILHPLIYAELLRQRDTCTGDYCILMLPILARSGMRGLVDRILLVDAPEELQHSRLVARDGIDGELAASMIATQESRDDRLAMAHDVLVNTGSQAELEPMVTSLHRAYSRLARGEVDVLPPQHLPVRRGK